MKGWILELGNEDFGTRQKAHEALIEMGWRARPMLEEYLHDDDPERRVRVGQILATIEKLDDLVVPAGDWD